jgi:hypothetical protein
MHYNAKNTLHRDSDKDTKQETALYLNLLALWPPLASVNLGGRCKTVRAI